VFSTRITKNVINSVVKDLLRTVLHCFSYDELGFTFLLSALLTFKEYPKNLEA